MDWDVVWIFVGVADVVWIFVGVAVVVGGGVRVWTAWRERRRFGR